MEGDKKPLKIGKRGRWKLDKCSCIFSPFFKPNPVSLGSLCAENNSLSGNQMLIKRKLHWMSVRKTGKIHPEEPHRSS